MLGAISYVGSHVLSLLYLALYGRYVSDTLSAPGRYASATRVSIPVPLTHKLANQHLLSALLRRKAEMFEVPVQFFSISPEQVKRTTRARRHARDHDALCAAACGRRPRRRRLRSRRSPRAATRPAGTR